MLRKSNQGEGACGNRIVHTLSLSASSKRDASGRFKLEEENENTPRTADSDGYCHGVKVTQNTSTELFTMRAPEGNQCIAFPGRGVGKTTSMLISKCHLSDIQAE